MPPLSSKTQHPSHSTAVLSERAELSALIHRDINSPRRGALSEEFRKRISPYLITDVTSDTFLQIHRAAAPLTFTSAVSKSLTTPEFHDFLLLEAPVLKDYYLNFKCRGHTGCVVVEHEATTRLNRRVPGCAEGRVSGNGAHNYTVVSIEGRDYWLDFTVDQFVAYPEIVECQRLYGSMRYLQPNPTYAGILLMPHRDD